MALSLKRAFPLSFPLMAPLMIMSLLSCSFISVNATSLKNGEIKAGDGVARVIFRGSDGCTIEHDCVAANCVGVNGTPPNCTCDCKPGWEGDKCNIPKEIPSVTSMGYTFEYSYSCKLADTWENGIKRCQSYGDGWNIATVPSAYSNEIVAHLEPNQKVWLGGTDVAQQGTWLWMAGRLKNIPFWPKSIFFAKWSGGNPDNWHCGNHTEHYLARVDQGSSWFDTFDEDVANCSVAPRCVACERSPCATSVDCVGTTNTAAVGYYPNCSCVCAPGWGGVNCSSYLGIANSTQNNYTSQFAVICVNVTSYAVAKGACQRFLNGWDIATVPGSGANTAIKSLLTKDAWLGGSDNETTGKWMWMGGRMKNKYFWNSSSGSAGTCDTGMYCNWGPSQPDTSKCGTSDRNVLAVKQSGEWVSTIDKADAQCNTVPTCVVCERSKCSLDLDCFASNSLGVFGYYPICQCDCRPGWQGNNCDQNKTLPSSTQNGYTSEYFVSCSEANTYQNAVKRCQSYGDEWDIATVPSKDANKIIAQSVWSQKIWLGGTDIAQQGTWLWKAGRLKDKAFWTKTNGTIIYSKWVGKNPDNWVCGNQTEHYMGRVEYTFSWFDGFDHKVEGCGEVPSCVACERSPCKIDLDCDVNGTVRAVGYYPNCSCTCQPGYSDVTCNTYSGLPNSTQNNYTSVFAKVCDNITSYASAISTCQSYLNGWDIATIPSSDANAAISSSLTIEAWFGGEIDKTDTGKWKWISGRMKGKYFWNSSSGSAGTCDTGMYCNWGPSQPNTFKCGTSDRNVIAIMASGEWNSAIDKGDAQCNTVPTCVVCERSPCNLILDCNVEGTYLISGYYPNCTCKCVPGWNGTKCDIKYDLTQVSVNDTVSEFYVYCQPLKMSLAQAVQECQKYGNGWDIASVPNAAANDAIAGLGLKLPDAYTNPYTQIWAGGTDEGHLYAWKWMAGRLKNMTFTPDLAASTSGTAQCLPGMYCNWLAGTPNDWTGCKVHETGFAIYKRVSIYFTYNWTWDDITDKYVCYEVPQCVACERSPCVAKDITCNSTNTINITGYYPSCKCLCKQGYGGPNCSEHACDITIDCNNNTESVNGTYPNCTCNCKPGWSGTKCDTPVSTTVTAFTTTKYPVPTIPTTFPGTTLSPGLPTCPFRGIYPCKNASSSSSPYDLQRGDALWPITLDLSALLSAGSVVITVKVLKNMPFNITAKDTELLTRSVSEEGVTTDVPYRREDGAAFFLDSIGVLNDRLFIAFNETTPKSSNDIKNAPTRLILRFISSSLVDNCCNGTTTAKFSFENSLAQAKPGAIDVGNITTLKIPDTSVDNRAISGDAMTVINNAMGSHKVLCKKALLGTSWVELTAVAPLGRLFPIDAPYYVRAIAANIILVIIVTLFHAAVVVALSKVFSTITFAEWCGRARFPSVTIGCLFAVSPGTAIAAGGLLGTWSGTVEGCDVYPTDKDSLAQFLAIIGMLIIILTFAFTLVYPLIWLPRSLLPVALLPGVLPSRVEIYFPRTVLLPRPKCDMFHSLVGTVRLPGLLWPSVPMWSSVVLFILAIICSSSSSFSTVSLLVAILHVIIFFAVLIVRPFYSFSLNFMFSLGLVPITLLALLQGLLSLQDSPDTTGGNVGVILLACLVTFTAMARLLLYIVQPSPCLLLSTRVDPSFPFPIWSTDIKGGNEIDQQLLNPDEKTGYISLNEYISREDIKLDNQPEEETNAPSDYQN